MNVVSTTSLSPTLEKSLSTRMLTVVVPSCIYTLAAIRETKEKHMGNRIVFQRMDKLNAALVPLDAEGNTPPSDAVSRTDITAELKEYGSFIKATRQVELQDQNRPLNQFVRLQGIQLRETEDILTRDMLASTSSLVNCVNGVNGDKPTEINDIDASEISSLLMNFDAKHTGSAIQGENRFGTGPIPESFISFAHTRIYKDLQKCSDFTKKANYPSQVDVPSAEVGTLGDLRILLSTNGIKNVGNSTNGKDTYDMISVGLESYGIVDQEGLYGRFFYNAPNDPLRRYATVGWSSMFAPVLLNDKMVIKTSMTLG